MLFRKEVIESRRTGWLGGIALSQPLSLRLLGWTVIVAAIAVLSLLMLGSYSRRSRVPGELVPVEGLAIVVAAEAGVVTSIAASEGASVAAGSRLAIIHMPRSTAIERDAGEVEAEQLERRRASLLEAKRATLAALAAQQAGLREQLARGTQELAQMEREIELRQRQVQISEESTLRFRELRSQGYVSELQLREQESQALTRQGERQSLVREAASLRRQLAAIRQSLAGIPAGRRAARADYQRDIASLEQDIVSSEVRSARAVVAPIDGVIATQLVKRGQSVQAGQALMTLIPGDGRLEAELRVPSRAIGFVEPGDAVLLRYQAYPYQKFGHHTGTVLRISRSALPDDGDPSQSHYRVVVALDRQTVEAYGQPESLKPGMLLEADIMGEQRSLIEWILEPLYTLKGKVASG